ncbi:MAG: hypothetical protein MUC77_17305 [Chromatiaceae bacterium]|nr:hypothetical protein [Chromatiaceae bacterium]
MRPTSAGAPPHPRELPLARGYGFAHYLLDLNGRAVGIIEAKPAGATLTGVELQSGRYSKGLPASLPAWRRPLPFVYESTGLETHFTNGLDAEQHDLSVQAPNQIGPIADFRRQRFARPSDAVRASARPTRRGEQYVTP